MIRDLCRKAKKEYIHESLSKNRRIKQLLWHVLCHSSIFLGVDSQILMIWTITLIFYHCYNKWAMGESKLVLLITHKGDQVSTRLLAETLHSLIHITCNMMNPEQEDQGLIFLIIFHAYLTLVTTVVCLENITQGIPTMESWHMNTVFITWKLELEWDTKQNEKCLERLWTSFWVDNIKFWATVISYVLKATLSTSYGP